MRILIVGDWDTGGGVQSIIRDLAQCLEQRDVHYSVFFFNNIIDKSPWWEFCEHVYYNHDISLTELLVKQKFDLVHLIDTACPPPYDVNRWLRRARYKGAVLCNIHVCTPVLPPNQFADMFVACSEAARSAAASLIMREIQVVPNGIDTAIFSPCSVAKPHRPVLGWVGRANDVHKDINGFLYAAAQFSNQYDFWIASAGPLPLASYAQDWLGNVLHISYDLDKSQLANFYSQIALSGGAVIATSTLESFHLVSVEAAACGCPIIVPRAAWSSHIEDNVSGLIYDRVDGLLGIKECLGRLDNQETRQRIIAGAFGLVQTKFNRKRMADDYYVVYQESLRLAQLRQTHDRHRSLDGRVWASALHMKRTLRRLSRIKS